MRERERRESGAKEKGGESMVRERVENWVRVRRERKVREKESKSGARERVRVESRVKE